MDVVYERGGWKGVIFKSSEAISQIGTALAIAHHIVIKRQESVNYGHTNF